MAAPLLARCRFPPPGTAVCCAVSGGSDSLALLLLAASAGLRPTAVHVDHGLRSSSASEAKVVKEAAAQVGASFQCQRVVVEPGPNLEARARNARYAVLPFGVMTGHTADD
ncbi:MAG: tRNA lysidine(34) synthetase TilS, partial [Actinomycetota bacterium]|nr:tRNA lysidine(34) synthetase TilS [Actinomycetota bacterium]